MQLPDVLIVKDFKVVFPKNLPGLPPDHEIEFEIKLAPGTSPISKEPYRMAPAELKDLHKKLQELLMTQFFTIGSTRTLRQEEIWTHEALH